MFGMTVRQKRVSMDLTQDQLAEKIGMEVRTVRRVETGKPHAKKTRQRLADALDMTPDELLYVPPEAEDLIKSSQYEFCQRLASTFNLCYQIATQKPMRKDDAKWLSNCLRSTLGKLLDRIPREDGGREHVLRLWHQIDLGIRPTRLREVAHALAAVCNKLLYSSRPFEWEATQWPQETVTFPALKPPAAVLEALKRAKERKRTGKVP